MHSCFLWSFSLNLGKLTFWRKKTVQLCDIEFGTHSEIQSQCQSNYLQRLGDRDLRSLGTGSSVGAKLPSDDTDRVGDLAVFPDTGEPY